MGRFCENVRKKGLETRYVAIGLSAAFISSVSENSPEATPVFDHFLATKQMNDKLDKSITYYTIWKRTSKA